MRHSEKILNFLKGISTGSISCKLCGKAFDKSKSKMSDGKWQCPRCRERFEE